MQSRKDAALRKIVENTELPIKTRREALTAMDAPSRLFLTRLANDVDVAAKLRLDAARRLPEAERGLSEAKTAKTAQKPEKLDINAGIYPGIDRSLDSTLGPAMRQLLAESWGSSSTSEPAETRAQESSSTAAPVPQDGVSKTETRSESGQPASQAKAPTQQNDAPCPSFLRTPYVEIQRKKIIERGRDLAKSIMRRHERLWRAPQNSEEQWHLAFLQKKWVAYEREARDLGVDVERSFDRLDLLRPLGWETSDAEKLHNEFSRQRGLVPTLWDAHVQSVALAERPEKKESRSKSDDGLWSGMPGGVKCTSALKQSGRFEKERNKMSREQFEAMRKKLESQDPFLKDANLDTRGLPGFRDGLPKEETFLDEKFGQTMVAENRESLRGAINQLVSSNDAEINALLKKAGIENPNAPQTVNLPNGLTGTVLRQEDGSFVCEVKTGRKIRRFISKRGPDNAAMMAARELQKDEIRELTPAERIEVARIAQSGRRFEAIAHYLHYRLGEERASRYARPEEMVADPELQPIMRECAVFCWLNYRPDVRDSAEFQAFLSDYAGARPINFDLLDAAWGAFLPRQEKQATRTAVARLTTEPSAEEIQQGLEDADDETVRKTFWGTLKHIARSGR